MWEQLAITVTVFLPLLGAGIIALIPKASEEAAKPVALIVSLVGFVLSLAILAGYYLGPTGGEGLAYQVNLEWIPQVGINYHVAIDGISMPLFVLTYLITFLCAIYCFHHIEEPGKPRAFLALMLMLQTGMAGCFIAFDLILFFVFWELVLVPMYFMIGIWGGPRREYAAVKFFLYTLFGSVFMLVAFLAVYFTSGLGTFDILALQEAGAAGVFTREVQILAFLGMFLGFAIKVPMWPFHTWLPDAHTEAPTVGSVLLAAILLKMGTYGFVRIALPILPEGAVVFAPIIGILAVIAILYGALCCLAQTDFKRLIAFSSVGHMGFVILGIATLTPVGINAASPLPRPPLRSVTSVPSARTALRDLPGRIQIAHRPSRTRVVGKNGLPVSRRLGHLDATGNHGPKHDIAEVSPYFFGNLIGELRPSVVHGQQDGRHRQGRVEMRLHQVDVAQQLTQSL
jgi:NADH-quinone oxidoreductase subunit M